MRFGLVALQDAEGAVLAHTARLPGLVLAKGTLLDSACLAALARAGRTGVVAAQLEAGDVAEDEAARRLARALMADGLATRPAGSGRVNLVAGRHGLFRADRDRVDALNGLDEGLTLATLEDATPVRAGEVVATVKVIPFAIAGIAVVAAEATACAAPVLRLPAFRALRVGLVVSTAPGLKESVIAGTVAVTERRVAALGGVLLPALQVAHEADAIAGAFAALLRDSAGLLLLAGASAVVDRADVGPSAIVALGGAVDHLGMPVDPGNLICLGHVGAVPAIVLPGCARSPRLNGIDHVLRRVFAGEPAGRGAVMAMGVGGLLKDAGPRPASRTEPAGTPVRVAALVLAAGASTRMGARNKLLLQDDGGVAMVGRVAQACLASQAGAPVVVTGHESAAVERAVLRAVPEGVRFVHAEGYGQGLSASLAAGMGALDGAVSACVVCLGDMPLVTQAVINQLVGAYAPAEGRTIVVPTCRGKRGNPVLWDRRYFAEMASLSGDAGARGLLRAHADQVVEVETGSEAVLVDFDTPESLGARFGG